ncbi:MAG: hypothetical protein WCB11_16925 [Terriglobales bacterium]
MVNLAEALTQGTVTVSRSRTCIPRKPDGQQALGGWNRLMRKSGTAIAVSESAGL